MKEQFIQTIQQHMLPYLNNEQMIHLQEALEHALYGLQLTESDVETPAEQINALESFIAAKRIEGVLGGPSARRVRAVPFPLPPGSPATASAGPQRRGGGFGGAALGESRPSPVTR